MNRKAAMGLVTASVVLGVAIGASADVGPPRDRKYVEFSFQVKGLSVSPEQVLFAYPCSTSNGVPMAEHHKIEDGRPIGVGRRGGSCAIYAVSKAVYASWLGSYTPTRAPSDPKVEALIKQSVACQGSVHPSFEVAMSDPRSEIVETLTVKTLNATTCILAGDAPPSEAASADPRSPSSPPPIPPPAKKSGCAMGRSSAPNTPSMLVLGMVLGLLALRRRSRPR